MTKQRSSSSNIAGRDFSLYAIERKRPLEWSQRSIAACFTVADVNSFVLAGSVEFGECSIGKRGASPAVRRNTEMAHGDQSAHARAETGLIDSVVILGGGTAGWMAATYLKK